MTLIIRDTTRYLQLLELFRSADCSHIFFGFESESVKIQAVNKANTLLINLVFLTDHIEYIPPESPQFFSVELKGLIRAAKTTPHGRINHRLKATHLEVSTNDDETNTLELFKIVSDFTTNDFDKQDPVKVYIIDWLTALKKASGYPLAKLTIHDSGAELTADDKGNKEPHFATSWGEINAPVDTLTVDSTTMKVLLKMKFSTACYVQFRALVNEGVQLSTLVGSLGNVEVNVREV